MMRFFAPQTILFALLMLIAQASISQAASACHRQEIIGQESSAKTWFSARRNARAKWVSKVSGAVGRRWNNWSFANNRGYMCWEKGAQKICKAAATPCNGRMKSVSLFPQDNKNNRQQYGADRDDRDRNAERSAARNSDEERLKRPVRDTQRRNSDTGSGYFTQTLLDDDAIKKTCNGRSTRISGKLLYGLAEAKRSASTLWSEYVGITKGQQWSRWEFAKRREIKCVPEGLRVKCEVSAIACKNTGKEQRHVNGAGRSGKRIALPVKRPDLNSFAFDETISRDPGEYGDGNADDGDAKIELPARRDGFSLPWVSKPPAGRPEPEDGEEGPFGANSTEKEFDISGLQNDDFGAGNDRTSRARKRFNQQGSLAPALPVKRPRYRQAARDTASNIRNGYRYQEDYQHEQLKNSGFSGLTLPQQRPRGGADTQLKKNRRFSQNFNTDNEGEEEDSFGGSAEPSAGKPNRNDNKFQKKNWNTDSNDARPNRKLRGRIRKEDSNRSRNRDVRDENVDRWGNKKTPRGDKKNKSNNWNFDSDTDANTEKRGQSRNKNSRRKRGTQGRNIDINVSRPDVWKRKRKSKSRVNRKRDRGGRSKKAQQNWNLDRALESQNNEAFNPQQERDRKSGQKRAEKSWKKPSRKYDSKGTVIGGWTADNEGENRSVTRRSGDRKGGSIAKRSKFKGRVFGSLGSKNSKINYMSNSGVMMRPNTFYGCKEAEVASWGKPQPTKPQARQAAIKSWQKVIYNKFGKNWSDWMKAGSSRVQCGTQNGMKKCVAIGSPCGEVALQKADDFVSTARCRIYALKFRGDSSADLAQAKQNAMNVWEKKIEKKYGSKWSDWFRSMEHRINCKKRRGKMSCQASAIPCSL